jgi:hypothetical protein
MLSFGRRPFWSLRRMRRRRDSCSIELAVRAAIPVALELPRREAAEVNMKPLNSRRSAVVGELNLELNLIQLDRCSTYRAGVIDPRPGPRAVGASGWQLSSTDRFSGLLAEDAFVGHSGAPSFGG